MKTKFCKVVVLTLLITGCTTIDGGNYEAENLGEVNVAVTLVAPWSEYVDQLSPGFELSAQEALKLAIPNTTVVEQRVQNAIQAGIKAEFGIPIPKSQTVTDTDADGNETTKETVDVDKQTPPTFEEAVEARAKELALASNKEDLSTCLLYTSPSPRDLSTSRMPSSA